MPIAGSAKRVNVVMPEHLHAFRRSLHTIDVAGTFEVHGSTIDDLIERSGDTYLWHREPGAAYRESSTLRTHMDQHGIDSQARLAHGALGLIYALETAYLENGDMPVRGVADVRFVAPVFEGARLRAHVERPAQGESAFEVMSSQVEPGLAITGRVLFGALGDAYDAADFASLGEQQLFSLEEAIGLVSALVGLWVEGREGGVLYMGQELAIGGLVAVGDRLEAEGAIVSSSPGRRMGLRTTARVTVSAKRRGTHQPIAEGEALFLYLDHESVR